MVDATSPDLGSLLGTLLGGTAGGVLGGSRPAGTTTTTTGQILAPGGLQNIQDTIAGRYLDPASNPYLAGTYDTAARQVTGGVNSLFEAGGRYGSGANQGVLGQNLSGLANNIYGTNYQNERTRQLAAASSPIGNTVTSPYFTNPLAGILSGALLGGTLGGSGGPGGGLGGILSGLGGLFGLGGGGSTQPTDPTPVDPNGPVGPTGPQIPTDPNSGGPEQLSGPQSASFGSQYPGFGTSPSFGNYGQYPKPVSTSPYVARIS